MHELLMFQLVYHNIHNIEKNEDVGRTKIRRINKMMYYILLHILLNFKFQIQRPTREYLMLSILIYISIQNFRFVIFLNLIFYWKSEMTLTPRKHLQVYKLKQSDPREYFNLPFYGSCFVKWDIYSQENNHYTWDYWYTEHENSFSLNLRDHPKIIFIFPGDNFV